MNKKYFNKKRFKIYEGYIFDKYIFRTGIIFIIVLLLAIVFVYGFKSKYYYFCDSPFGCEISEFQAEFCNTPSTIDKIKYGGRYEWMNSCGLCSNNTFVYQGFTCGEKVGKFQGSEVFITIIVLFMTFLTNHMTHNRDFEFKGGGIV